MSEKSVPPDNDRMTRCPRLGHQISFSYCRTERGDLPCFKALDCWFEEFDVYGFFRREMTEEQMEKAFSMPKHSKMMSLVQLIEHAGIETSSRKKAEKDT